MFGLNYIKLYLFRKKYRKLNKHNETCISNFCDLDKISVGKKTYGMINVIDFSPAPTKLKIGSYCSIAPNVTFLLGGEHNLHTITTFPFKVKCGDVKKEAGSKGNIEIGNDVWIGANVVICSGITIGQGAVVGAGSVVTKNVPPYAIVCGCPSRIVKYRFNEELREKLQKVDIEKLFDCFNKSDFENIYTELNEDILKMILEKYNGKI